MRAVSFRLPLVVVALALLVAPVVLSASGVAQREAGTFEMALDPKELRASPGANMTFSILLRNPTDRALVVDVVMLTPGGLPARGGLEQTSVRLDPGHNSTVGGFLHVAPDAEPGNHTLTVRGRDASGPSGAGEIARHADLLLRIGRQPVSPDLQPPPAIKVVVEPHEVEVAPGAAANFTIVVSNVGSRAQHTPLSLRLPPGWHGALAQETVTLEPGATVEVRGQAVAPETAPMVGGPLLPAFVVGRPTEPALADFRLRLVEAPVAQDTQDTQDMRDMQDAQGDGMPWATGAAWLGVGVAGAGAAVAGGVWLRRHWPLLLAPFYTRLKPSRLLEHPLRERIVDEVRGTPGVTYTDLERRLGVAKGVLTHHTRMLEQGRILFSSPDGQLRRFYVAGSARVVPRADLASRALELLRQEGPLSASELARRLDVSRQALHYHLKKMLDEGRVQGRQEGRELVVALPVAPASGR